MEDLPLLTAAERALCRVALDAQRERRIARGADDKAAKQVDQSQRMGHVYRMDADKEASFDAAAHPGAQSVRDPQLVGSGAGIVGVDCKQATFPLLSGVDINPDLFEKKHKQEHKPTYGHAKCGAIIGSPKP